MPSEFIYSTKFMPSFPTLSDDAECDVLVIGGGLCGLLCAHYLQNAGINVLVCEADRIAMAVSSRSTAVISVGQDILCRDIEKSMGSNAARTVIKTRLAALDEYRHLCRELDCICRIDDFYLYSLGSPIKLEEEYDRMRRFGVPTSLLRDLPIDINISAAIKFSNQLMLDPIDFCARLAERLCVRENTRITKITPHGAETENHKIYAKQVIIATHFPLPRLKGLFSLKLYQERSYVLAIDGVKDIGGAYEDTAPDGAYLRMYKNHLLLGGGDHRTGTKGGGFEAILKYSNDNLGNLLNGGKLVTSWATQDTVSLDGLPYIGRLSPTSNRVFVATGFGGYGFVGSMTAALILRDLILYRNNPAAKLFDPSRSMMSVQLFKNMGTTLGNFVLPTTKRCPHLGCALKWNASERSWDCPCHGSRFDNHGKLLNDPAQHDL